MKATADIAWEGGTAAAGDTVDPKTIPPAVLARWLEEGVLVETKEKSK